MTARDAIPALNTIDSNRLLDDISHQWDIDIVAQLIEYIKLPAKSPGFDHDWAKHGFLDAAIEQARQWVAAQPVAGLTVEVVRADGRTPVLFFDIPAVGDIDPNSTVLLYGHLDKQPEMTGWRAGFGPWTPVYESGKLYGRGSADDGYAVFAAMSAIMALDKQGVARPHCIGLIETCEESGSYDLPFYLASLAPRMGDVKLVMALDSGAGNYDQLWVTTSLRGLVNGTLTVKVLTEGVHSGDAGGVVPSSFRVARQLLDRIDDSRSGVVKLAEFTCQIPDERVAQARQAADTMSARASATQPGAIANQKARHHEQRDGARHPDDDVTLQPLQDRRADRQPRHKRHGDPARSARCHEAQGACSEPAYAGDPAKPQQHDGPGEPDHEAPGKSSERASGFPSHRSVPKK